VCLHWVEKNTTKLGGPNTIVEIDEAKIGKRKYNRGRIVKGNWIFGGYERNTRKVFIVQVPDRTEKTLLNLIKEWILDGTTIISDCWRSYDCLNSEGFQHLKVNHSMNFVDPDTGAHTQHIERVCREVRANIPQYGTRSSHLVGYLAEFLFKRVHKYEERLNSFFLHDCGIVSTEDVYQ
ncbi:putative transposase-like protein, partial [Lasius niger]